MTGIRWPVEHRVAGADIHAANRAVSTASPEQVWAWIVRADRWSEIYPNAHRVRHLAGPWPEISLGSRFVDHPRGTGDRSSPREICEIVRAGQRGGMPTVLRLSRASRGACESSRRPALLMPSR